MGGALLSVNTDCHGENPRVQHNKYSDAHTGCNSSLDGEGMGLGKHCMGMYICGDGGEKVYISHLPGISDHP
jgi:hypothetical protein